MTVARKPSLNEICAPIQTELAGFSAVLNSELASADPLIQGIHDHLLKMTGKFLRPMLAILCSRLNGRAPEKALRLAAAVELIHTATLVHDDIIDDSQWRRNQPSVHSKWGRDISIVSGDYLYAKAFLLLAGLEEAKINQGFATCAHVMCEGEMKQIERRKDFGLSEEEYLRIIHKKTAALFQAACMGGAYLGGSDPGAVEALGRYGFALGMAFQIVDDCLDLVGETETLGKKAGLDLTRQDMTLPLLYLLADLGEPRRSALIKRFAGADEPELFSEIRRLALEQGSVERAMARARRYASDAAEALRDLPVSPYRESLAQLVEYCLERVR